MPTGVEHCTAKSRSARSMVDSVDEGGWAFPATVEASPPATPVAAAAAPQRRGWMRWAAGVIASASEWIFGAMALGLGLALLAATPVAQFLSLGYLLEAEGRVARTGRLRDGLVGVRRAGAGWEHGAGCVALAAAGASGRVAGPLGRAHRPGGADRATLAARADRGDRPDGAAHRHRLRRGGRFRHFVWPPADPVWLARRLRRGRLFGESRDAVWQFVTGMRLPAYFRLGFLGFAGTLAWLVVPVTLLAAGPEGAGLGVLGGLLLAIVALVLPFLQAHYAAEGGSPRCSNTGPCGRGSARLPGRLP